MQLRRCCRITEIVYNLWVLFVLQSLTYVCARDVLAVQNCFFFVVVSASVVASPSVAASATAATPGIVVPLVSPSVRYALIDCVGCLMT